jgi:hypothetical protein
MIIPQIQVELILECGSELSRSKRFVDSDLNQSMILTDEIPFSMKTTYLNIIILDENDNAPIFTHPDNSMLGYPDPSLIDQIFPPYLTIVLAHDKDEGLNATIGYSINDNPHFTIDEKSGVIYPLKDCFNFADQVELTVTATDRDGASDGNWNSIKITVVKIPTDSVVSLRINEQDFKEFDSIFDNLAELTKIRLRVINYAPVPEVTSKPSEFKSFQTSNNKTTIKMFLYAFDDDQKLIPNNEIIESIENSDAQFPMEVSGPAEPIDETTDESYIPWMISTIILSVMLLLIFILGGISIFILRKRLIEKRVSDASRNVLKEDFDKPPSNTSPVTKNIFVIPNVAVSKENDPQVSVEKKKSNVTFSDVVEKIDADQEKESSSTFDQRL